MGLIMTTEHNLRPTPPLIIHHWPPIDHYYPWPVPIVTASTNYRTWPLHRPPISHYHPQPPITHLPSLSTTLMTAITHQLLLLTVNHIFWSLQPSSITHHGIDNHFSQLLLSTIIIKIIIIKLINNYRIFEPF